MFGFTFVASYVPSYIATNWVSRIHDCTSIYTYIVFAFMDNLYVGVIHISGCMKTTDHNQAGFLQLYICICSYT